MPLESEGTKMKKNDMGKLNTGAIIKSAMAEKGYTYAALAEKCGYATAAGVSERIRSDRIGVDVLYKLMTAMDCEIVVRSTTFTVKEMNGKKEKVYSEWKVDLADE